MAGRLDRRRTRRLRLLGAISSGPPFFRQREHVMQSPVQPGARDIAFLALAAAVIVLALYPYWLFGSDSMLGWYDEFNGTIPWYFALDHLKQSGGFMHGYAGGVSAAQGYLVGTELVSMYRILLRVADLWIATLTFRLLGMLVSVAGLYFAARELFGAPRLLALSAGLCGILVNFVPYGWMAAAAGWCPGLAAWMLIALFGSFSQEWRRYLLATAVSVVAAITSPPVFLLPFVGLSYLCFRPLIARGKGSKLRVFLRDAGILAILTVILTVNWAPGLYTAVLKTQAFSARLLQFDPANSSTDGLFGLTRNIISSDLQIFQLFLWRQPQPLLIGLYAAAILLSVRRKAWWIGAQFAILIFVLPVALHVIASSLQLPILSKYKWDTLWEMQSVLLVLYFCFLNNGARAERGASKKAGVLNAFLRSTDSPFLLSICLLAFVAVAIYQLTQVTMINLTRFGGGGVTHRYENFGLLAQGRGRFRTISAGRFVAPIPTYYGVDTFDGLVHTYPVRRSYFVAYAMHEPAIDNLNTSWHVFYEFPHGYDLKMFRLANIRYLVTSHPTSHPELRLLAAEPARHATGLGRAIAGNVTLTGPAYFYELSDPIWPRVFAATDLRVSPHGIEEKPFYDGLDNLNIGQIVVAKDDEALIPKSMIFNKDLKIDYTLTEQGIQLRLSPGGGIVVVNEVYTPYWHAECAGAELPVFPVNGIMMAVSVPKSCSSATMVYRIS